MNFTVTQFAQTDSGGLLDALGIDWRMLVFQLIGFCVLVFILGKYVFPIFNRVIEEREKQFADNAKAAETARKDAEAAEKRITEELDAAKKQSADILEVARKEAAKTVEDAGDKASKKADHLLEQAQARIDLQVSDAKRSLQSEMVSLVASATEKVIGEKLDARHDNELIKKALKDAER